MGKALAAFTNACKPNFTTRLINSMTHLLPLLELRLI